MATELHRKPQGGQYLFFSSFNPSAFIFLYNISTLLCCSSDKHIHDAQTVA